MFAILANRIEDDDLREKAEAILDPYAHRRSSLGEDVHPFNSRINNIYTHFCRVVTSDVSCMCNKEGFGQKKVWKKCGKPVRQVYNQLKASSL